MNKENIYDDILNKKYGEVLGDVNLRKQLINCLHDRIFKINNAIYSLDEDSLSITLTSEFFDKPLFFWGGKPSETRIRRFYEIMRNIERNFDGDLVINRSIVPSPTNLSMNIKFYFTEIQKGRIEMNEIAIKNILSYLQELWTTATGELAGYGYDVRPQTH